MKKTNKIYTLALIVGIGLVCSCKNSLDLTPTSNLTVASFWKTKDDAQGALTGLYASFRSLGVTLYRSEMRSEIYEGGIAGTGADYANINNNVLTAANTGYPDWIGYYKVVNDCNLLLKYVPGISFATETEKNQILGEATAMRAYLYFNMTRIWGDLIIRTEPIESTSTEVTIKARSPQSEVFAMIKGDIENALNLIPTNNLPTGRIRWSKAAVNAMKAEVYLWSGKKLNGGAADFNTAIAATQAVETADVGLLPNFADVFPHANKGNREMIFAIRNDINEGGAPFMHYSWFSGTLPASADAAARNTINPTGQGIGLLIPTKLVRDQFINDDSRRAASFLEVYSTNAAGARTYFTSVNLKFSGFLNAGTRIFVNDAILYRLADVILMRAEARNALGQDPSTDINRIRQRAFGTRFAANAFVNGTQAQNNDAILKERLLELMFEGKRWFDLVRFDKAFDLVPNLQSRKGQNQLLLFPISLGVLSLETQVRQNPGY